MSAELKGIIFDLQGTLCLGDDSGSHPAIVRPKMADTIGRLRDEGVRLAVVSGYSENKAIEVVGTIGLGRFIETDFIIGEGSIRSIEEMRAVEVRSKGWLGKLGVRDIVERPQTIERVLDVKPSADGINYLRQVWGLEVDEVAFTGDGLLDKLAASRASVAYADANLVSFAADFSELVDQVHRAHQDHLR